MMNRIWNEESGVLTFEWILLITVLVIGVIGGVAAMRNAINTKASQIGSAIKAVNCSYTLSTGSDSNGSQGNKTATNFKDNNN